MNIFEFELDTNIEIGAGSPVFVPHGVSRIQIYKYNIILNGEKTNNSLKITEDIDNSIYTLDIYCDYDKDTTLEMLNEFTFQCQLENIIGSEKDFYLILFGTDYETVSLLKKCDLEISEIFYKKN
jgi:hypothetical protein